MNIFKLLWNRKQDKKRANEQMDKFARAAKDFSDNYPEALVIIGDPQSDCIFMSHQGVAAPVRIINRDGSRNYIVSNALKHQRGAGDIDRFLLAVDGGLFAIAQTLYTKRRSTFAGKAVDWVRGTEPPPAESLVKLADGAVLSPIQIVQ